MFRRRRKEPSIALAGAGSIAVVHALAARSAGLRIAAVASRGGSSARHLAGQLDSRRCRPEELPGEADLLVVATPPSTHVSIAMQGLSGGAGVLVEKPVAATLADADMLAGAVESAQLDDMAAARETAPSDDAGDPVVPARLRVAENLLHAPAWREVMARRPGIEALSHLSLRTVQPPPDWGHFLEPMTEGGVLLDLGPHPIAIAVELAADRPVAVAAAMSSSRTDGADDRADVSIRFAGGLVATLEISWVAEAPHWEAQAAGTNGVLRLELIPEVLVEHDGEPIGIPLRHQAPDPRLEQMGYVDQLLDTMATIGGESGRPGQTIGEAIDVLEVIYAAYASAGSGGVEIGLPFGGDRAVPPLALWR